MKYINETKKAALKEFLEINVKPDYLDDSTLNIAEESINYWYSTFQDTTYTLDATISISGYPETIDLKEF